MTHASYGKLSALYYDVTQHYASEQEVDFYADFLDGHPGRVLEAMSGSGRLQLPLMQRGYVVDGVDASEHMLGRCRQRAVVLGLQPELHSQLLQDLSLTHRYAVAIIAFGSLQLIADRAVILQALKKIHAHMEPFGDVLIDCFIPDRASVVPRKRSIRLDDHTIISLITRSVFDDQNQSVDSFRVYELTVDGVVQEREDELIQLVWYNDEQWRGLLRHAGFEIVNIHETPFYAAGPSQVIHAKAV
ncbi:MAG TPA: class I SAM-dependent methyltransferase [Candidatus Babeliales bacterium]|nr:class I SAM-dependent methyltransferase [Candidatus Babeliales bacterium]